MGVNEAFKIIFLLIKPLLHFIVENIELIEKGAFNLGFS